MPDSFKGFGLYELDSRCRLSLPRGLETYASWLNPSEDQVCLAVPGPRGLAIFPPAALEEHRELMSRLRGEEPRPEDLGSAAFDLARAGTITWSVSIGTDRRIQLPLGARELGIVPAIPNATVALVAFRGVIEIWHPSELREYVQKAAGRWAELKALGFRGGLDGGRE